MFGRRDVEAFDASPELGHEVAERGVARAGDAREPELRLERRHELGDLGEGAGVAVAERDEAARAVAVQARGGEDTLGRAFGLERGDARFDRFDGERRVGEGRDDLGVLSRTRRGLISPAIRAAAASAESRGPRTAACRAHAATALGERGLDARREALRGSTAATGTGFDAAGAGRCGFLLEVSASGAQIGQSTTETAACASALDRGPDADR